MTAPLPELPSVWDRPTWTVAELVEAKAGRSVAVVLPALNESDTVAGVVESVLPLLGGLVDDLVVLDSGSTDDTVAVARAAGARVVRREEALPEVPPVDGKGEVLWRSIAATTADVIVFIDSDLVRPDPMFVPKLVGPILTQPEIELVKGYYRRPWRTAAQHIEDGGGRVTELVARPLLAALRPELSHVVQPLGGEYAGTRDLLASLPFAPGYGVEIGLLIDTLEARGPQAIGQVNLGVRMHRHRPLTELGVMSRQIVGTLLRRCGIADSGAPLVQFAAAADGSFATQVTETVLADRPPMDSLRPRTRGEE
ncbi:glucosyl-3-phosphoglycerate synthase [Gordonia sp. X0973]|uniref:glucosyl-3-phosphoglycerate synthase n=1 Tax=Gordonia sp. X0973 TaxID=2742602 RepID=UPI000F53EF79|nr:glucosyl-3-phosphoglycerate synthase [Gordonia sp. X0973]QKT07858.1 glucosyl-3-phosphoglycerate synthase [Gordonia sp. X0973]